MRKTIAFVALLITVMCAAVSKDPLGPYYTYGGAGRHTAVIVPEVDPPPPPPSGPGRK